MSRFFQHTAAALVAVLLTATTFVTVVTLPADQSRSVAVAPMLA